MSETNKLTDATNNLHNLAARYGYATEANDSNAGQLKLAARAALDSVPAGQAMKIYSAAFDAGVRACQADWA